MTEMATTPETAPVTDTQDQAVETQIPSDGYEAPEADAADTDTTDSDQSEGTAEGDNPEPTTDDEPRKAELRQADYTRKTQELAEIRKGLTERATKLDHYVQQGEALVNVLASEFQAEFQGVDWGKLAAEDPAAYVQKRHAFDERQRKLQLAVGQLQATRQQQAETEQQTIQQRLIEEQRRLVDVLPEWKDPKRATTEAAELREYLGKAGYGDDEVNGVTDHRAVILARKAMLYDRMVAKAPKPQAMTKAPPPVQKAPTRATGQKDISQMTDAEFKAFRARQIAQRRP